jgi:hypothetical protein
MELTSPRSTAFIQTEERSPRDVADELRGEIDVATGGNLGQPPLVTADHVCGTSDGAWGRPRESVKRGETLRAKKGVLRVLPEMNINWCKNPGEQRLYPKSDFSSILVRPLRQVWRWEPFWQRFAYKKASRWKMRCAGSSGRYSRRTSSRKSSVTPTT